MLKKLAAILLFAILLFNAVGYRFVFNYFEHKTVTNLEQKIDANNYSDGQLREISIPLNMPYYGDKEMELVSGELEMNGLHYQYVKRKIENNILHIWCLPNYQRNDVVAAKNNLAKSTNQVPNQSKKNTLLKLFQTEFVTLGTPEIISHTIVPKTIVVADNYFFFSQFKPTDTAKPPEIVC
jgi:hypothetical protein